MTPSELSVLMISQDPGLISPSAVHGDLFDRHKRYSENVRTLDIIVFGGAKRETIIVSPRLHIHATGVTGLMNLWVARRMGSRLLRLHRASCIVTQNPHAAGWVGLSLKRRFHIPLIVNFHGDFWSNQEWRKEKFRHKIYYRMQRHIVLHANGIRAVSYGIRDELVALGIPQEKIEVINTPVSDTFGTFSEAQQKTLEKLRYRNGNRPVLLFVGRLAPAKNLSFMFDVIGQLAKTVKDVLLLIIGEGELRSKLERQIREKKLHENVRLLGPHHHHELVVFYHLASVFLLFSTNESFGKVIIEAGMAGLPTLASKTTGAKHIVRDGRTGFLVPVNDLTATVEVLEYMLLYPDQTKQLGEWAHEIYSENYSAAKTTQRLVDFWVTISS